MPEEDNKITWERRADEGTAVEVSTAGLREYSALNATFAPGTVLGIHDISGKSIEEVYQHVLKRSGRGKAPSRTSYLHRDEGTRLSREDFSYYEGYLPLWTLWAGQNPGRMDALREALGDRTVLTDRYATNSDVTQARALADILNGEGRGFDEAVVGDYFQTREPAPQWDESSLVHDVYTLGTGRRSLEEFLSLIPPGTTRIVDVRNTTQSTRRPYFNRLQLKEILAERGIAYEWMPSLSGKPKKTEPQVFLNNDPRKCDYTEYMKLDRAKEAYAALRRDIAADRVTIISSEDNPVYSARTLMLGQQLARDGVSVGHISGIEDYTIGVDSQQETVLVSLGRRMLADGRPEDIEFNSDRSIRDNGLVTVRERALPGDSAEQRRSLKPFNYGTEVSYAVADVPEPRRTRSEEAARAAHEQVLFETAQQNARWADYTVVFTTSPNEIPRFELERGNAIRIPLPSGQGAAEALRDPERARRVAETLRDAIGRSVVARSWDDEGVDLQNVRLNIVGSHIARLANQFVEEQPAQDEISDRSRKRLAQTGLSLEDRTGVSQEDVNVFLRNVLTEMGLSDVSTEFENREGETYAHHWRVTEIRTAGETGVAEAATLASQYLRLRTSVVAAPGFRMTIDNESLQGGMAADEVMFKNRFSQGLRREVTPDDIQENLALQEFRRGQQELSSEPGLTDRQILTLKELEFTNSEIIEIHRAAVDNGVRVGSPEEFADFLENCSTLGIASSTYISTHIIASAQQRADDQIREAAEKGYGVLTVASSNYPELLKEFKEYSIDQERLIVRQDEYGTSTDIVTESVRQYMPAVLWYQGADPSVAEGMTLTFLGDPHPEPESLAAARNLAGAAAGQDVVTVGALDDGSAQEAVEETVRRDEEAVVVSPEPIDHEENREIQDRVQRGGGVTFSETGPGRRNNRIAAGDNQTETRSRATKIAASLGKAAIVVNAALNEKPMSVMEAAAWTTFFAASLVYAGARLTIGDPVRRHRFDQSVSGNAKLAASGARTVGYSAEGMDEIIEDIRENTFSTQEEVQDEGVAVQRTPAACSFRVLHCGDRHVFLIPEDLEVVREAVRREYGQDARIESPARGLEVLLEFDRKQETVTGITVNGFSGYKGTQVQEEETWYEDLFYDRGRIESLTEAPSHLLGLPSRKERRSQAALFDKIKDYAEGLRARLNEAAGLDPAVAYHYENAIHPVIRGNVVELRRGEDSIAEVRILPNGRIEFSNNETLSDSLQEHAVRRQPVFTVRGRRVDALVAETLCNQMEAAVLGTMARETWSIGDREEREDLKEKIAQGWEKVEENNLDVAAADAARSPYVSREEKIHYAPSEAYAQVWALTAAAENRLDEVFGRLKELEKEGRELTDALSSGSGLDDGRRKEMEDRLKATASEFKELLDPRRELATRVAELDALRNTITTARSITISEGQYAEASTYSAKTLVVDGRRVELPQADPALGLSTEEALANLKADRESLRGRPFEKVSESVSVSPDGTTAKKGVHAVADYRGQKAGADEVASREMNGVVIIKRGGQYAYASSASLEILSRSYPQLSPFNGTYGQATDAAGRRNLIDARGDEVSPVWYDRMYVPSEGMIALVQLNGKYNHFDFTERRLLSEYWVSEAHNFSEGYALIKGGFMDGPEAMGRYNYINTRGELIGEDWYRSASDFKGGVAKVERDGRSYLIDRSGREYVGRGESVGRGI